MTEFTAEELAHERWVPIPWLTGLYEVSDLGRVKSLIQRGGCYRIPKARILRPYKPPNDGYPRVGLPVTKESPDKRSFWSMHSLVLTVFVGPRPVGMEGAHNDGNPSNNRLSNLRWATRSDNHRDKRLHGTARIGSKAPNAKLTEEQVRELRDLYSTGKYTQKQLAKRFGLSNPCSVGQVIRGERWAHVDVEVLQKALNETQDALRVALQREAEAQQARNNYQAAHAIEAQKLDTANDLLRRAQEDTELLDALIDNFWHCDFSNQWYVDDEHGTRKGQGKTPREAIRAAISAHLNPQPKEGQ